MFLKAIKKWNIDVNSSVFIGDKVTDKMAAQKSKVKFYFKKDISLYKQVKNII
jgi:histidinol phosphatase-like enzyme